MPCLLWRFQAAVTVEDKERLISDLQKKAASLERRLQGNLSQDEHLQELLQEVKHRVWFRPTTAASSDVAAVKKERKKIHQLVNLKLISQANCEVIILTCINGSVRCESVQRAADPDYNPDLIDL